MRVRLAPRGVETCWKTKQQYVTEKTEDRFVHGRVSAFGSTDRALHDLTIFFVHRLTRCEIGSVNREAGNGFAHSTRKRLEREISIPAASLRDSVEHVAQDIDIVRQRQFHHLQFFRI